MDNNNQNLNNQVNQNNNNNINQQMPNNNTNKIVFVLMALIIVGLVGYIVYTKFIEKDDNTKPNNTQESSNNQIVEDNTEINDNTNNQENNNTETNLNQNEQQSTNNNVDKNIYKTADGKHTLNIKDFKNKSNPRLIYDGKTIKVASDDSGPYGYYESKGKYAVYGDGNGQCSTYFFIVNTENNTLVNFDSKKFNDVVQIGNNYYFIQKEFCGGDGFDIYTGVYTENMKKIGTAFFGKDDNNNIYVLDKDVVVKYDQNGKELFRSNKKYEQKNIIEWYTGNLCEPVITSDNNLYFVYSGENDVNYLVDVVGGKEIQINKKSDSQYKMNFYGCDFDPGSNNFVFTYDLESCGSGCWSDQLKYTYNIKTGNLTSKTEKTESTSYTE